MNHPNPNQIAESDLQRFHEAAKLIEVDAEQGYLACKRKYGYEIATALLIAFYRRSFGSMESYPAPDNVESDTNNLLKEKLIVREACSTCGS